MAERVVYFVVVLLIAVLCWIAGYITGRENEAKRWNDRYRDLCERVIQALKRRDDD